MEFVTHKTYYDPAMGKTHQEPTIDGRILQKNGCPKHPVWLVGNRVTLSELKADTESFFMANSHIKGKICADKPLYVVWLTLPVYDDGFSGSPILKPLLKALGLEYDRAVTEDFIENLPSYFKNKNIEITGTLQLSKSGLQKLEAGNILMSTHLGSLYTLEDIEVKII